MHKRSAYKSTEGGRGHFQCLEADEKPDMRMRTPALGSRKARRGRIIKQEKKDAIQIRPDIFKPIVLKPLYVHRFELKLQWEAHIYEEAST